MRVKNKTEANTQNQTFTNSYDTQFKIIFCLVSIKLEKKKGFVFVLKLSKREV